jgi:GT2 family glycosyltransferase
MRNNLSVIVSTKKIDEKYKQHLYETCGLKDVEILFYENPNGISLTEIYNKGLSDSKNEIVVFCHDDLIFNSQKWGKKLLNIFNNSEYGIIGVAGSTYMPTSGKWWEDQSKMVGIVKHSKDGKTWVSKYSSKFDTIIDTCNLDGLFFSCDKHRIKNKFDENIKGFHFYDVDFTFGNYISGVKIGVTFDIELTHKSIGMTNDEWEQNRRQFIQKYTFKPNTKEICLPTKIKSKIFYEDRKLNFKTAPKVEIIIPNINKFELLRNCIESYLKKSTYPNMKITVADTGSDDENLPKIKDYCEKNNVKLIEYDYYHFEKINNDVVKNHLDPDTELLLFSNNDIVLINDCVSEMINLYLKNKNICGTVGARLYFEDDTIQHAGIDVLGTVNSQNQFALRIGHVGFKSEYLYPNTDLVGTIGNTAALQLISKELFIDMGYFPEDYLFSLSDVEFNLKTTLWGKKNCFAHNAVAYHFESLSKAEKGINKPEDWKRVTDYVFNNKRILNSIKTIKI